MTIKTGSNTRFTFENLKDGTRKVYQNHLDNFFRQGGVHDSFDSIRAYFDKIPNTSRQAFLYAIMHMNPDEEFKQRLKRLLKGRNIAGLKRRG